MTKLLSGLFASLMLCAVIGCGGDSAPTAPPETPDAPAADDVGGDGATEGEAAE